MAQEIKLEDILNAIKSDPSLSDDEKETALEKANDPSFVNKLIYGGFGAGIASAISNWIKLSRKAKIILAVAGFGLGQLVLEAANKKEKPLKYNKMTKTYEVQ